MHEKDFKILAELELNSRISYRKLARKLNTGKESVIYRIKKMQNEGTLIRFFIDIDASKLGLILYKALFQFQNADEQIQNEIFDYLSKQRQIAWVVICSGRWDLIFVSYVRDAFEQNKLVENFLKKYGKYTLVKEYVSMPQYYVCSRKWLVRGKETKISKIGGKSQLFEIDEIDRMILKKLAENSRYPIKEIALLTKTSSSLILQRIKKLEKAKVIMNYRIGINYSKLGKEFCKSFIYFYEKNEQEYKKFITYSKYHEDITAISEMIAPWEVELEMEVPNLSYLHKIMQEIKNKFRTIIRNYEAVVITKEYGIDYTTFL